MMPARLRCTSAQPIRSCATVAASRANQGCGWRGAITVSRANEADDGGAITLRTMTGRADARERSRGGRAEQMRAVGSREHLGDPTIRGKRVEQRRGCRLILIRREHALQQAKAQEQ